MSITPRPAYFKLLTACCIVAILAGSACKKNATSTIDPMPEAPSEVTLTINRDQKHQTIDGFGFFGAQSVWWETNTANLYSDAWATQVIEDLGITIWRNEYFPPATPTQGQDANWNKQKVVVEGLNRIAKEKKVNLKNVFTVWSPPADLKCAIDASDNRLPGTPNPGGTKGGGTLDPAKINDFASWLVTGIQLYKDVGVDVYAISPQNEPLFKQSFNSCFYKPEWYAEMLKGIGPVVKASFPEVKIFGSENMLEIESGKDRQYFYHKKLMEDGAARQYLDIWAVHGYLNGVAPTATSQMAQLWKNTRTDYADPGNKPVWMTETSGYQDTWLGTTEKPGAIDLALAIHAALYHGKVSAWVWWQGSDQGSINEYNLMQATSKKSKRYYVSKQFYRFIRPGARMVEVSYNENEGVFASAFENQQMGAFTMVLINTLDKEVKLNIAGNNIPDSFDVYQTTSSENCVKKEAITKNAIVLPSKSVVTLVNGNVFE